MGLSVRAAALLALLLLAPVAAADHAFSHRVYVMGRVLDAEGLPVPGEPVSVAFEGLTPLGACLGSKAETTSETGDFVVCRHAHGFAAANATIEVAGLRATRAVDPVLRGVEVLLRTEAPRPRGSIQGDLAFRATFRVEGRAFALLSAPEPLEGVPVNASPRAGENATARLGDATGTAVVDDHGVYSIDLSVGEVPPGAHVVVEVGGAAWSVEASPVFRRANVDVVSAAPEAFLPRPGADVPGLGALAALAAPTFAAARRRR